MYISLNFANIERNVAFPFYFHFTIDIINYFLSISQLLETIYWQKITMVKSGNGLRGSVIILF